jgi:hypothetical protein
MSMHSSGEWKGSLCLSAAHRRLPDCLGRMKRSQRLDKLRVHFVALGAWENPRSEMLGLDIFLGKRIS